MDKLNDWLSLTQTPDTLIAQIQRSPATPKVVAYLRQAVPDLSRFPSTTYSLYREFENTGQRESYQRVYFAKRSQLTRAVLEMILGDDQMRAVIHDLLWSICEETTWVLPAHEEQGPEYWDLKPSPGGALRSASQPWGAHTMLTRPPDSIDLFAAETGASLAETIYFLGDRLAPEVVQRVRQEVDRRIFQPYLAYGKNHWWYKGALNWNGVCNGSIGLAFMRLEKDANTLVQALNQVLEGFEAYIATGFEPDGGSIEGISYWNYGLMYFVTLAELLREKTGGKLDLLADNRLKKIALYPLVTALAPGTFINFGDATEQLALTPGIVQRLAEHTGVSDLLGLFVPLDWLEGAGVSAAKLPITLRTAAWWDGNIPPFPASAHQDAYLPDCAIAKFVAHTPTGKTIILAAKAGHNDGHHSHTDVGQFILHADGETLLCDPGRGLYSREYFRKERYQNFFCNSLSHNVPRIAGQLQKPGPEFGGRQQYHGEIIETQYAQASADEARSVIIDIHPAYDIPGLIQARRSLKFDPVDGRTTLLDEFTFSTAAQEVEEAFVTWLPVEVDGASARLQGQRSTLLMEVTEPSGCIFTSQDMREECRRNHREGNLTRLSVKLPEGTANDSVVRFGIQIMVQDA
ncbi:MAG: heparinase II/III family protein [Chloroflexota bacterium]